MQPTSVLIMAHVLQSHQGVHNVNMSYLQDYVIGDHSDPICEDLMNFDLFANYDLLSYEKVAQDYYWLKFMDKEIQLIEKNSTQDLTNLFNSMKSIGVKWVYKTKHKTNGEVSHFKVRLMVQVLAS